MLILCQKNKYLINRYLFKNTYKKQYTYCGINTHIVDIYYVIHYGMLSTLTYCDDITTPSLFLILAVYAWHRLMISSVRIYTPLFNNVDVTTAFTVPVPIVGHAVVLPANSTSNV